LRRTALTILLFLLVIIPSNIYSQSNKVPPFQIIQANGRLFRASQLPMGKPIVIVYFSPECEECHQFTKEITDRMDEFRKASVVLITYFPREKVMKFVTEFNLDKYSNLFVGTEGDSYFVGNYYKVAHLPFVALYSKNGDLIEIYNQEISMEDLLVRLRNL
jgi:cytochrome oxidase Cu insertion factor (SCO1/SenC/PrrC family)